MPRHSFPACLSEAGWDPCPAPDAQRSPARTGSAPGGSSEAHLGDAQGSHVLAVGRGAAARAPGSGQEAADALHADAAADGVPRRRGRPAQPGTGVVISHGLQHGRDHPGQYAKDPSQAHRRRSPLPCKSRAGFSWVLPR